MGEPISSTEYDALADAFRHDAQAYCSFIDAWRASNASEPFVHLLQLLSNLAQSGAAIPSGLGQVENDVKGVERIDHTQWKIIAAALNQATSDACAALWNLHSGDEEAQVRVSMLWDDLADLYRDLLYGLDLHSMGTPADVSNAIWEWRFGYENHWGEHLFRALSTVHEIRYRLFMK